jgi:DNA modification methylase
LEFYLVKFGDVIKIGPHTLLCGDATEKSMVAQLLGDAIPQLMITDPPYGVKLQVRDRHKANSARVGDNELEDLRVRNDHRANWSKAFYLSRARIAYVWHAATATDVAFQAFRDGDYEPRQAVVWVKNRAALSRAAYHWKHESAIYGVRQFETAHWKGDRKQTTVWEAEVPPAVERIHPTQKPLLLYTKPIENHTDKGDIIYDPFAGSGTIFAAAQETGRIAKAVEIEPAFCQRIMDRMKDQYGLSSKIIGNVFTIKASA